MKLVKNCACSGVGAWASMYPPQDRTMMVSSTGGSAGMLLCCMVVVLGLWCLLVGCLSRDDGCRRCDLCFPKVLLWNNRILLVLGSVVFGRVCVERRWMQKVRFCFPKHTVLEIELCTPPAERVSWTSRRTTEHAQLAFVSGCNHSQFWLVSDHGQKGQQQ